MSAHAHCHDRILSSNGHPNISLCIVIKPRKPRIREVRRTQRAFGRRETKEEREKVARREKAHRFEAGTKFPQNSRRALGKFWVLLKP